MDLEILDKSKNRLKARCGKYIIKVLNSDAAFELNGGKWTKVIVKNEETKKGFSTFIAYYYSGRLTKKFKDILFQLIRSAEKDNVKEI